MLLVASKNVVKPLLAAPKLVAQGHCKERGVVCKFVQNAEAFVDKVLLTLGYLILNSTPERKLRFHIDTQLVGGSESSVGRTAGVEAVMVYTVLPGGLHDREPALGIGRGSSRHGEYHSVVLAAQKYFLSVKQKVRAACLELPHTERNFHGISAEVYFHCIGNRVMLAPKLRVRHFVHKGRVFGGQNGFFELEAVYLGSQGNAVPACYCSAYEYRSRCNVGGKPYIFKAETAPKFDKYFPGNTQPVGLGVLRGHMSARNRAGNVVHRDYYFIFTVLHKLCYIVAVSGAKAVIGTRFFSVYPYG